MVRSFGFWPHCWISVVKFEPYSSNFSYCLYNGTDFFVIALFLLIWRNYHVIYEQKKSHQILKAPSECTLSPFLPYSFSLTLVFFKKCTKPFKLMMNKVTNIIPIKFYYICVHMKNKKITISNLCRQKTQAGCSLSFQTGGVQPLPKKSV